MTLHDLLDDVARGAPPGAPDPDLWDRARRRHRRRQAGVATMVAVVVLAVASGVGLVSTRQQTTLQPADSQAAPALPSRVYEPGRWLPVAGPDDPPGPLSTIIQVTSDRWFGLPRSVTGAISATDGSYLRLDLPDDADEDAVLSPDGRHLAYWTTSEPPQGGSVDTDRPVTGLAIFDTVTGEVQRLPIDTPHGLASHDVAWAGPNAVVLTYLGYRDVKRLPNLTQARRTPGPGLLRWTLGTDTPFLITSSAVRLWGASATQAVVTRSGRGMTIVDLATGRDRSARLDEPTGRFPRVAVSDSAVAYRHEIKRPGKASVRALTVVDPQGRSRDVPVADLQSVVGLVGSQPVVAIRKPGDPGLTSIEVLSRDGRPRPLMSVPSEALIVPADGVNAASDLFAQPTRDFPPPPHRWDPRVEAGVAGGVALVAMLGALVAVVIRRRRHGRI